jgi:hypothetical protein
MRSLTAAGVLLLAASVVACSDSPTQPELVDGPLLQGSAPRIVLKCVFPPGDESPLPRGPVTLPDERDELQAYRTVCMNNGGHLKRDR